MTTGIVGVEAQHLFGGELRQSPFFQIPAILGSQLDQKQAAGGISIAKPFLGLEQEIPHGGFRLLLATAQGQLRLQQLQREGGIGSWVWQQGLRIYLLDLRGFLLRRSELRICTVKLIEMDIGTPLQDVPHRSAYWPATSGKFLCGQQRFLWTSTLQE